MTLRHGKKAVGRKNKSYKQRRRVTARNHARALAYEDDVKKLYGSEQLVEKPETPTKTMSVIHQQ